MVEVRQGAQSMSEPSKVCEALILSGRLRHNGQAVLRWNMSNIAAKEDKKGNIFPYKPTATKRIDGGIGLITSLSRLIVAPAEYGSVYERHGLLSLYD
jgi:phage terminase large subunit-like protein